MKDRAAIVAVVLCDSEFAFLREGEHSSFQMIIIKLTNWKHMIKSL